MEAKDVQIKNMTSKLSVSQIENQKVRIDIVKLQTEQINLVAKLNEHKAKYNQLSEQLMQEERKEKEIQTKV